MTLGELIQALEAASDRDKRRVRRGFHNPHSYRGYYDRLAFEPASDVTVQSMLDCAKEALGGVFEGYKGGDYAMHEYTDVYLANYSECGEKLGPTLLSYMLENYIYCADGWDSNTSARERTLNPHGPRTRATLWREVSSYIENEGLHYALVHYTSPESQNCDQLDPELAKMWREYIALSEKIEKHVGVEQ